MASLRDGIRAIKVLYRKRNQFRGHKFCGKSQNRGLFLVFLFMFLLLLALSVWLKINGNSYAANTGKESTVTLINLPSNETGEYNPTRTSSEKAVTISSLRSKSSLRSSDNASSHRVMDAASRSFHDQEESRVHDLKHSWLYKATKHTRFRKRRTKNKNAVKKKPSAAGSKSESDPLHSYQLERKGKKITRRLKNGSSLHHAEDERRKKHSGLNALRAEWLKMNATYFWHNSPWKLSIGQHLNEIFDRTPSIFVHEKLFQNSCPGNCSGYGYCNHELGKCFCQHGYEGGDCSVLADYPCNHPSSDRWPLGRYVASICPATCDHRTAQCRCGPLSPFPDRPAVDMCGFSTDMSGAVQWDKTDPEALYGNKSSSPGWCMADSSLLPLIFPVRTCFCNYDGQDGPFCQDVSRAYCLRGCTGHGDCHTGFCQCHAGWYGVDCSIPSGDAAKGQHSRLVERKSPLIYVYELPPEFNVHLLQGRQWKRHCVPWMYNAANETDFNFQLLYGAELALYEGLLGSPHRTTNASRADYFFVPVLSACVIARSGDSPRMELTEAVRKYGRGYGFNRPHLLTHYILRAKQYIEEEFPFWSRHQGRDHIWLLSWDEGSCHAPDSIRNSILLSSFGNTMSVHKGSTTSYKFDEWGSIPAHVINGSHPCFLPSKDIVLPAWKAPDVRQLSARLWKRPIEKRPTLFYFNGNLGNKYPEGRPEPRYSMGIRQQVAEYFSSQKNLEGNLGRKHEAGVVVTSDKTYNYNVELSSSVFCGVFPGDGFSARLEDSVLHGCIPVIIQDGIQMAWENVLNFSAFSVRLTEDQIPHMLNILKAISEERRKAMWRAVRGVWQRWTYHSVLSAEYSRQKAWHGHDPYWGQKNVELTKDDAIDTLIQVLYYKLHNDPWRKKYSQLE